MLLKNINIGKNFPNDINVIIEISYGNSLVKYEISKVRSILRVDRFMRTPVYYPFNYGYINGLITEDSDFIDVLLLCKVPLIPLSVINCRPIGILKMLDENGIDNKVLAVPNYNISKEYDDINDIFDISKFYLDEIKFFFKNYKILDDNKWTKIDNFYDVYECKSELIKLKNKV